MKQVFGELSTALAADAWCETGCIVDMYHGQTDTKTQKAILTDFTGGTSTIRCVIATVSFGLGVEVNDVRHIHWGPPTNILTYWQEVGRGARDGNLGKALMYVYPGSLSRKYIENCIFDYIKKRESQECL